MDLGKDERLLRFLIPRMVLWDLLKVTILSVTGMSLLMMLAGAMIEAMRQGLDPIRVVGLMPLLAPTTFPYTIPTCLLFACTFVYGRMSANVEIIALKAAGIHVMRIVWPAFAIGIGLAGAGVYLADRWIPECHQKLAEVIFADLETNLCCFLRQNQSLIEPNLPYEIYVSEVRGQRLMHPILKHRDSNGQYDLIAQAAEATIKMTPGDNPNVPEIFLELRLRDGVVSTSDGNVVHFRERAERLPAPGIVTERDAKIETLSLAGCQERADDRHTKATNCTFDLACHASLCILGGDPHSLVKEIRFHESHFSRFERKRNEATTEKHFRLVQALCALPFVLIGCPAGMMFQRRDFLHTFFLCFLPIITVYYPSMALVTNIAKEGVAPPFLVLWLPPLAMAALAIPLFRRVFRF